MAYGLKRITASKLHTLALMLNTPGLFKAKLAGCDITMYKMLFTLFSMGIRPATILDIGASSGNFTKCSNYLFSEADIYAFEPISELYERLCGLQKKIRTLKCYNIALGNKTTETVMHKNAYINASSLLEISDIHKDACPRSSTTEPEVVKVDKLDSILNNVSLQKPLLIKIDVQGYENLVLEGAKKILRDTDYIICELSFFSLYKNQSLFNDLYSFLLNSGFSYFGPLIEHRHPRTHSILQIDGLFMRKMLGYG
ncbi:MAG: FkbM family methyltransferase [Candidatus Omnitrophica bacterium]|nr:FkbM family methyltransferase [Candidatus Omnitrophota bacterium]